MPTNSESETPEQYYWRLLKAKTDNADWTFDIPADRTTERANERKCLSCGNPNISESVNGSNCKRCFIKGQVEIYGRSKEDALNEYNERKAKMEARTTTFKKLAKDKKVSHTLEEELDLPF